MPSRLAASCAIVLGLLGGGCPASSDCPPATSTTGGSSTLVGGPVVGIADRHCWAVGAPDGGSTVTPQAVSGGSCDAVDGGAAYDEDAGPPGPAYGPTQWNTSGYDDDCKYVVGWHSTPIMAGAPVTFWVSAQLATNGAPLAGLVAAGQPGGTGEMYLEVAGAPDGGLKLHVATQPIISGTGVPIVESPVGSGVYQIGPAVFFDASGLWYVRFHFNENCDDVLPDSPHGHAAFYVNVP